LTEVPPLIAQGKIKAKEHAVHGLENTPQLFADMLKQGGTSGKPVIVVAEG
jgi:NADPH-dependent curcumin reductase CurA